MFELKFHQFSELFNEDYFLLKYNKLSANKRCLMLLFISFYRIDILK